MSIYPVLIVIFLVVMGVWVWKSRTKTASQPIASPAEEPAVPRKRDRTFLTFFRVVGTDQKTPSGVLLVAPSQPQEQETKAPPPD